MIAKKIDRYIGKAFLVRLIGTVLVLSAMYVSTDVLGRLDEMDRADLGLQIANLLAEYRLSLPMFMLDIMPGLILVSAGLVLVRMSSSREMLALKASGTSLYRVCAPLFVWTLLLSVVCYEAREAVAARYMTDGRLTSRALRNEGVRNAFISDLGGRRRVFVRNYDFATKEMTGVLVIEVNEQGHMVSTLNANRGALAEPGKLLLHSVRIQEVAEAGGKTRSEDEAVLETEITPLTILNANADDDDGTSGVQPLSELRRQMERHPRAPYFHVAYHSRLASFFMPTVLLLIGMPLLVGFEQTVRSRFLGIIVCILVAAGMYGVSFILSSMGMTGALNSVLCGWLPTIGGAAVGLWLFGSMQT